MDSVEDIQNLLIKGGFLIKKDDITMHIATYIMILIQEGIIDVIGDKEK